MRKALPRNLARLLLFVMLLTTLSTVILPLTSWAAEADEKAAANAEYEAKKTAYREKLKANDVTPDDLLLGSWISFYSFDTDSYEYQLDQMANAGLNFNIFPRGYNGLTMYDAAYWETVEKNYADRNMVYLMNGGLNAEVMEKGVIYADGKEHCIGYHLVDEPGGSGLQSVGEIIRDYREADPNRYPFVNLLPSYAGEAVLGGTYREYVENYVKAAGAENIEYLSHDFYVFRKGGDNLGIYADMEVMRSVAYENGKLKTHAFPQSTAWGGTRMPNIDEMRWNVYVYLAYGFKALSWFNLVCPGNSDTEGEGFFDSLIYRDGTIRNPELFAAWGELNWEVRGLSDALMNLDAQHAYHTKENVVGVEVLPSNFMLTPVGDEDFVVSYMVAKDGSEPHIMLFNKSTSRTVKASFHVDQFSGIEAIEYLDPFTGEYVPMDISAETLNDTFRAGEGKLYRLKGNVQLSAPPYAPSISLEGGHYYGQQTVTIVPDDSRDSVYYTLDGSYPNADATLYTEPIVLGENGKASFHTLRVATVRGNYISEVLTYRYFIDIQSGNAALGLPVTFTAPVSSWRGFGGSAATITDGILDIDGSVTTAAGTYGWAILDLGAPISIDGVRVTVPEFDKVDAVIVQVADDARFAQGVSTVYAYDPQSLTGYGSDSVTSFDCEGRVTFDTVQARYLRVLTVIDNRSVYTEIEVNATGSGVNLAKVDSTALQTEGDWTLTNGIISLTGGAEQSVLNSYIDTSESYKGLTVNGTFSFTDACAEFASAGVVIRSKDGSQYLYAGVTRQGSLYVMCNNKRISIPDENKLYVDITKPFTLRITKVDTYLRIEANGQFLAEIIDPAITIQEGYVGINGNKGAAFTAENISILSVEGTAPTIALILTKVEGGCEITIPRYATAEDVLAKLDKTLRGWDENEKGKSFDINWVLDDLDTAVSGTYVLTGYPLLPEDGSVVNPSKLSVKATVLVLYDPDYQALDEAIALVESLKEENYTAESWQVMQDYYQSALSMKDGTMPQNAVTVAAWQLMDKISQLIPVGIDFTALDAALAALSDVDLSTVTAASRSLAEKTLALGQAFSRTGLVTQAAVDEMTAQINAVKAALIPLGDTSALAAKIDKWKKLDLTFYTEASANSFLEAVKHLEKLVASGASQSILNEAVAQVENAYDLLVPVNIEESTTHTTPTEPTKNGCRSTLPGLAILPVLATGLVLRNRKKKD